MHEDHCVDSSYYTHIVPNPELQLQGWQQVGKGAELSVS